MREIIGVGVDVVKLKRFVDLPLKSYWEKFQQKVYS